jgi:hypothetical protein
MDAEGRQTDVKFMIANEAWKLLAASLCGEDIFVGDRDFNSERDETENDDFAGDFEGKKCPNANKTGKNPKKPVETEGFRLTKRSERMKVNCGSVLRTRMNIDDFALETGCGFTKSLCGPRRPHPRIHFESKKEQHTWQRE